MKKYSNTLNFLIFICILFPFWIANNCIIAYELLSFNSLSNSLFNLLSNSFDMPVVIVDFLMNFLAHFICYFFLGYLPICIVLIIIGLISDIIIYAVKKSREK